MGILLEIQVLYIGFPSVYISRYFTGAKFESPSGSVYYYTMAVMKQVSEIGALIGCV